MKKLILVNYLIQKNTICIPKDKCGVLKIRIFHLFRGFFRKKSKVGEFIKCSARKVKPNNIIKRKTKLNGVLINSKYFYIKKDGTSLYTNMNCVVLLKKRMTPKGNRLMSVCFRQVSRYKFMNSFPYSI